MRRFAMSDAPRDGTIIVGCTRVEGVEHLVRWTSGVDRYWISQATGKMIAAGLLVSWRSVEA